MNRIFLIIPLYFFLISSINSQWNLKKMNFSKSDSLLGGSRPERNSWDIRRYDLKVEFFPESKSIQGVCNFWVNPIKPFKRIQIDLNEKMELDSIYFEDKKIEFVREKSVVWLDFNKEINQRIFFKCYFHGSPIVAKNAPWDGGFVWSKSNGKLWAGVACEGIGASVWWPCKDDSQDEPDSMSLSYKIPNGLVCIGNGKFMGSAVDLQGDKTTWNWQITYPINPYNVTFYIGDYIQIQDTFRMSNNSSLDLNYWVLRENEVIAKKHFAQVKPMLRIYEKLMGPYPFSNDGYSLVESPYLGMEHQSAIAYGNKFQRGYLGGRIPDDMNWDFIIIHESGHEYFGNSISAADHGDLWIHESFTTWLETYYVEKIYGKSKAVEYLNYQRPWIQNKEPLRGPYGVRFNGWSSSDIYYRGSWMIHTLRNGIKNDELFFSVLKKLFIQFGYKTVNSYELVSFFSKEFNMNLTPFFNQYLLNSKIPKLVYKVEKKGRNLVFQYHWENIRSDFSWPFALQIGKKRIPIEFSNEQKEIVLPFRRISRWDDSFLPLNTFLFEPIKISQ
jgi:aminopeptidase N